MKSTTSLCFSKDGLINPDSLSYLQGRDIEAVVLFSDGSEDAYNQMLDFDLNKLGSNVKQVGVGRTPLYDMRVYDKDGIISKPHYLFSEDDRIKWICSKICSKYLTIHIHDESSQSKTQVRLDESQTELVCYLAYGLWREMLIAEDRLAFPAAVIDRMTRYTYSLTPNTIDIVQLRSRSGLQTLDYSHQTDMLSIEVGGDLFSVKLSVLNDFYGAFILPRFNSIYGRRLRIMVSVMGDDGNITQPSDVSYGELGRIVDDMRSMVKERLINAIDPMVSEDLLAFAKRVKINEDSCFWATQSQSTTDLIISTKPFLVQFPSGDNQQSIGHNKE